MAQVWRTPGLGKSVAPMQLHRTYGGCHGDIAALDWSADSQWIAVASKDLTARRGPGLAMGVALPLLPPPLQCAQFNINGLEGAGISADSQVGAIAYTTRSVQRVQSWFTRRAQAVAGSGLPLDALTP